MKRLIPILLLLLLPIAMEAQQPQRKVVRKRVASDGTVISETVTGANSTAERKNTQKEYLFTREDSLSMVQIDTLDAAIIQADEKIRQAVTQTSLTRIDADKLTHNFAMMGTTDLVRVLQQLPGVASGTELMSGLYVRGGDGSDNLFLLDGVPMYQVSHLIGLFSSFNTDVIDGVDFYKGGFPARYGGRLSSVVDVGVKEGNFEKWKGSAALGAIDGHFQIDGPIVKGKTSLNFGVRRTWTDIVKSAAMLFVNNPTNEEMASKSHYDFGDFNLKLTHKFNPDSKLIFSAYYGQDLGNATMIMDEKYEDGSGNMKMDMSFRLRWGNTLGTLKWERRWNEHLLMDAQLYHTRYSSNMKFITEVVTKERDEQGKLTTMSIHMDEHNLSRVFDTGAFVHFYSDRFSNHNLRFGGDMVLHTYDPSRSAEQNMKYNGINLMSAESAQSQNYGGGEVSLFAEDEISFSDRAKLNVGVRDALYIVSGKVYNGFEPRVAARFFASDNLSFKASYSAMNQFTHQVAATYLDLPTNLWMPSTAVIKPMHADQGVLGCEYKFSRNLSLDVECFYKYMTHLYEYTGTNSMLPQIDQWENVFSEGKGRSYGAEFSLEYKAPKWQAAAYYTLSKSERLFDQAYYTWYPDRNDNRHRLTLTGSYRFNRKFELYAGWTYHTGNRFTGKSAVVWEDMDGYDSVIYEIYDSPNSFKLPAYHRLDIGFNWHHKTKKGGERTMNISLYNAYCHINPMFGFIEEIDGHMKGIAYGLIPIVPSVSYTWKF